MNKIPNRQAICDTLMKSAAHDPDLPSCTFPPLTVKVY